MKTSAEAARPLGSTFSEQASASENGKEFSLEAGETPGRWQPGNGVWYPYPHFIRAKGKLGCKGVGYWSGGSWGSSDGEASKYRGTEERSSWLLPIRGTQNGPEGSLKAGVAC